MFCEKITDLNRDVVNAFIKQHWYTMTMIIRGIEIDMTKVEGFYFREGKSVIGLVTYLVYDNIFEIISLDSLRENQGIGSELLKFAVDEANKRGCRKVVLITTNDNIRFLYVMRLSLNGFCKEKEIFDVRVRQVFGRFV